MALGGFAQQPIHLIPCHVEQRLPTAQGVRLGEEAGQAVSGNHFVAFSRPMRARPFPCRTVGGSQASIIEGEGPGWAATRHEAAGLASLPSPQEGLE
jgi:hypothetical protein